MENCLKIHIQASYREELKDWFFPPNLKCELCNFQKSKIKIQLLRDFHALCSCIYLSLNTDLPHKSILQIFSQASTVQQSSGQFELPWNRDSAINRALLGFSPCMFSPCESHTWKGQLLLAESLLTSGSLASWWPWPSIWVNLHPSTLLFQAPLMTAKTQDRMFLVPQECSYISAPHDSQGTGNLIREVACKISTLIFNHHSLGS